MRLAADPVHGLALCGELYRPDECRIRGAHHEQGPRLFARSVRVWSRDILHRLRAVPGASQRYPRTRRCAAMGFLHPGGVGLAVGLERAGPKSDGLLRGAVFPRRRGSRL